MEGHEYRSLRGEKGLEIVEGLQETICERDE